MKSIGIILAGGSGKRLGGDVPKQFLRVRGKMIIEYTIEAFQNHQEIDEIVIVCHPEYTLLIKDSIRKNQYFKVKKVLNGGKERYHSSLVAIDAYDDGEEKKMLFHDGVRPLITANIISKCIQKLDHFNAVGVGIQSTDTVWSASEGVINSIPDRNTMYRAQTPQGFKYSIIRKAYSCALQDKKMLSTDDCGVVMHYLGDEKTAIILGDENNIKITRLADILLLENLLKTKS